MHVYLCTGCVSLTENTVKHFHRQISSLIGWRLKLTNFLPLNGVVTHDDMLNVCRNCGISRKFAPDLFCILSKTKLWSTWVMEFLFVLRMNIHVTYTEWKWVLIKCYELFRRPYIILRVNFSTDSSVKRCISRRTRYNELQRSCKIRYDRNKYFWQ